MILREKTMCSEQGCNCEAAMRATYRECKALDLEEPLAMAATAETYLLHHPHSGAYLALAAAAVIQKSERTTGGETANAAR